MSNQFSSLYWHNVGYLFHQMSASVKSHTSLASSLTLIVKMEGNLEITDIKHWAVWMKHYLLFIFFKLWIYLKMLIFPSDSVRVTSCFGNCNISATRTPVNVLYTISVNLSREQNGAELRCEAWIDLGPDGPQPSARDMSSPLNITVLCEITFTFAAQQSWLIWYSEMKRWWDILSHYSELTDSIRFSTLTY